MNLTFDIVYLSVYPVVFVQIWCTEAQDHLVKIMMEKTFDTVVKRYWWKSNVRGRRIQTTGPADDVQIAWVGLRNDPNKKRTPRTRSKVVLAPAVTRYYKDETGKKCETEQNGVLPFEFFAAYSNEGDWVGDFMCGSGSATIAAAAQGRSTISFDLSIDMVRHVFLLFSIVL